MTVRPADTGSILTTELIAKTIAGIGLIGDARSALEAAGHPATISADRLNVEGSFEARLLSVNGLGWWNVYSLDGIPPVWTVSAKCDEMSNWIGCVE